MKMVSFAAYMKKTDFYKKQGFTIDTVIQRYLWLLRRMDRFIKEKGVRHHVVVNDLMLKTAVVNYFVDIVRMKEFHAIEKTNTAKKYSYMGYWLLRRKPIQLLVDIKIRPGDGKRFLNEDLIDEQHKRLRNIEFINELFITAFIVRKILWLKNIDVKNISAEQCRVSTFGKFQDNLYYHLRHHHVTQQSLALMIGAFFCGCDLPKKEDQETAQSQEEQDKLLSEKTISDYGK